MYLDNSRHEPRSTLWRKAVPALSGLLALACCARPLPKPPAVVPPPPPPPPVASRPTLHASWTFQTGPNVCLALANAGHTRLAVIVRRKQPIRLSVILPDGGGAKPTARFHGPAGAWSLAGWESGKHEIVFTLGRDMDSLSRVLMLLSGGVMDLHSPERPLPLFTLSASGSNGQSWFSCARRLVI